MAEDEKPRKRDASKWVKPTPFRLEPAILDRLDWLRARKGGLNRAAMVRLLIQEASDAAGYSGGSPS